MIVAILLAAGKSSRTGNKNKLLIRYRNSKVITQSIKNLLDSKVDKIIIVIGKNKNLINKYIPIRKKIEVIYNKKYSDCMASSIIKGIKNLPLETNHFFITLADMPKIPPSHYDKMIKASLKNTKLPVVTFFKKRQFNPVLFPINFLKKIKKVKEDKGAKLILKKEKKIKIFASRFSYLKDFDTLNDFK